MVSVVDVALPFGAWFSLAVFLALVFRYELDMNVPVSAMTSVSATSVGILLAVGLQVAMNVPFLHAVFGFAVVLLFTVALYELVS